MVRDALTWCFNDLARCLVVHGEAESLPQDAHSVTRSRGLQTSRPNASGTPANSASRTEYPASWYASLGRPVILLAVPRRRTLSFERLRHLSFSRLARLGDQLARLIDAGVPVRGPLARWGFRSSVVMRSCVRGSPGGCAPARRGQIDREQIVAVFTATGSIKAAAKASGISASPARRVLVAEGLVDEARRPHNKVQAKRRFLELVGLGCQPGALLGRSGSTNALAAIGVTASARPQHAIHSDGTVIDYTTGSRYTSL